MKDASQNRWASKAKMVECCNIKDKDYYWGSAYHVCIKRKRKRRNIKWEWKLKLKEYMEMQKFQPKGARWLLVMICMPAWTRQFLLNHMQQR